VNRADFPFQVIEKPPLKEWSNIIKPESLTVIDSFSYLIWGSNPGDLRNIMEFIRNMNKRTNSILILVIQKEMMEENMLSLIYHNSDGIILFRNQEKPENILRYIQIPKWIDGRPLDINIYYSFEYGKIKLDTRSRVI
jgi:KaiC/GvpD/RAD55 family RecA-like ATPase